jgi:hypothetical protein
MFNIVKRRDFMLGQNVSEQEAEKARDDHGKEYIVVSIPARNGLDLTSVVPAAPPIPSVPAASILATSARASQIDFFRQARLA